MGIKVLYLNEPVIYINKRNVILVTLTLLIFFHGQGHMQCRYRKNLNNTSSIRNRNMSVDCIAKQKSISQSLTDKEKMISTEMKVLMKYLVEK